jgi:hypothetical protein
MCAEYVNLQKQKINKNQIHAQLFTILQPHP